ncbi:MAG: hypothetical protein DYG92_10470 [Leptolyngbya sp. PLA1]|nr:hypothetical protein [Leptolyngbya sp. PLA1]
MKIAYGIVALLALAGAANAQFVATNAGPINSDGPIGTGTNGSFGATYGGAGTIFGNVAFTGDLTSNDVGSYLSEARWNVKNLSTGAAAAFQFASGNTWSGTVNVAATRGMFLWASSGDNFSFEAYESYNDSGIDASWSNVSFTFNSATIGTLGNVNAGDIDFDTFTSTFDTEIAIYTSAGVLLGTNDDAPSSLQSQILLNLAEGDYYVIIGGYNSLFGNGGASGGNAAGDFVLNINGANAGSGSLAAGGLAAYSLTVVPTPGALALLGLGGLVAASRRR